jgi:hypothetical protein
VGTSNVSFMKRMWYSNNMCLTRLFVDIYLIVMFHNIMLLFFPSFWQIPNVSWAYGLNKHRYITNDSKCDKSKVGLRRFILSSLFDKAYNIH